MKTTLVIMAAGLGSRYGGNKQTDGVGPNGEILMEYGVYDAVRAGFDKIVFIIKPDMLALMKRLCGDMASRLRTADGRPVEVCYAYQDTDTLPTFYTWPEGRTKPLGTAHAVLCTRELVHEPFCVINADDYYGVDAYRTMYSALRTIPAEGAAAMVGYMLRNTVTEHGHVARGICQVENGLLTDVVERLHIEKRGDDAAYTEDGEHFIPLSGSLPVSMNFWGFKQTMMQELKEHFPAWLDENLPVNPLKCEYFLPFVANALIKEGRGTIRVLPCHETWHGITYKEDMPSVVGSIAAMRKAGIYPEKLWE